MLQNGQNQLTELQEDLAFSYSSSDLESASLTELQEMKAIVELDDFLDGEIDTFKEATIQTKEQLVESIKETRKNYQKEAVANEDKHSPAFYEILDNLLKQFESIVKYTSLPDPLHDWWCYSYEIQGNGINLLMNHFSWSHNYDSFYNCCRDEKFVLLAVPAKLLTVSEYAEIYGVKPVTVRQWIRRAKIRSVVKAGREWRISELTEKPEERGYFQCQYRWAETLTDLPDEYAFLSAFHSAEFCPDKDTDNVRVTLFADMDEISGYKSKEEIKKRHEILDEYPEFSIMEDGALLLTSKQREKLEVYMLGHPLIHCASTNYREGNSVFIAEFGEGDYDGVSVNFVE